MAKPNLYAEKASQQLEVVGRKLRTNNPDFVREILRVTEKRAQREQRRLNDGLNNWMRLESATARLMKQENSKCWWNMRKFIERCGQWCVRWHQWKAVNFQCKGWKKFWEIRWRGKGMAVVQRKLRMRCAKKCRFICSKRSEINGWWCNNNRLKMTVLSRVNR